MARSSWANTSGSRALGQSRGPGWLALGAHRDATYRHMSHGPILPMEEPGFFQRLFGRR